MNRNESGNPAGALWRAMAMVLMTMSSIAVHGAEALQFDAAWSRATVPGASNAAIYGTLVNTGPVPLKLRAITTDVAQMGQVHESVMEHDMMHMRHRAGFTIAPGEQIGFSPGGLHIMLMGLSHPLIQGETFHVRFETDDGEVLVVPVVVGAIGQMTFPGKP